VKISLLSLKYPELESAKKEVSTEVHAYIDAITVLSSLQDYIRSVGIECHIERKLEKKNGNPKKPDLLICSDNYIIVDHKYTESENEKTLAGKLEEMREYNSTFVFSNGKPSFEKEFTPEVVMLTPEGSVASFRKLLDCPITWGYILDSEVVIKQMIWSIKDSKVLSLFNPNLICAMAEEISRYKFFISHPPLPYASCEIYNVLWTLSPPQQFFAPEFEVKYKDILGVFNSLFPPWISGEAKQLNVKRLEEALDFLQRTKWVKWFKTEKLVIVYRNKGRNIADTLSYLIDFYAKVLHTKRVIEYQKEVKKLEQLQKPVAQKKLDDFS
jgi:hypothetical protein